MWPDRDVKRRFVIVGGMAILVFVVGTGGYMVIEGWNITDAMYMVIITLSTVGYSETHPLSFPGRVFTMFLILGGTGTLLYAISSVTVLLAEGELQKFLRRRRMDKKIGQMRDHYIVCGAGKTGIHVIHELAKTKHEFVVVERDPEKIEMLGEEVHVIQGDATQDEVLKMAGVERARGLVTCLPNDADNLFVVLTARGLNPSLRIVARANDEESYRKIFKAGADSVVSPNFIGGLRMVSELIRPTVVTFLDTMLREKGTLRVEEATVAKGSKYVGKRLQEVPLRDKKINLLVVAIKKDGDYIFNPQADTTLEAGDVLVVIGEIDDVKKLRKMLTP